LIFTLIFTNAKLLDLCYYIVMNQTIVALIRPNLNLAQRESQAAHVIEHILLAPKRLEQMGITAEFYSENIITDNGNVDDFYMVEYYVVRSDVANQIANILKQYSGELFCNREDFERIKSTVLAEVSGNKGEFIDLGEQFTRAAFRKDSPSNRNPWNDLESIENLTYEQMLEIFQKYNTDIAVLEMSYDNCILSNLPKIESNFLIESKKILNLTHPWQSLNSLETVQIVPALPNASYFTDLLYRCSLEDFRFGLLFEELRNKLGLVYEISINVNYDCQNYIEMIFSSNEEDSDKVLNAIEQALENYEQFIMAKLDYIRNRMIMNYELDWGDIQNNAMGNIDRVISAGITISPREMAETFEKITIDELVAYNKLFLDSLKNNSIKIKRRFGKEVSSIEAI